MTTTRCTHRLASSVLETSVASGLPRTLLCEIPQPLRDEERTADTSPPQDNDRLPTQPGEVKSEPHNMWASNFQPYIISLTAQDLDMQTRPVIYHKLLAQRRKRKLPQRPSKTPFLPSFVLYCR